MDEGVMNCIKPDMSPQTPDYRGSFPARDSVNHGADETCQVFSPTKAIRSLHRSRYNLFGISYFYEEAD